MKLLIVESPSKAKNIKAYLGTGWIVAPSYGHIRDLPEREMGVEAPEFRPNYVVPERSRAHVAKLKQFVKDASEVFLAADPDREGEAIAWHIAQVTKPSKFKRVRFSEVTKTAIEKAIANAGDIDINMVKAQEARRVLDRLVGYTVSPFLTKMTGSAAPLSAGRVQSVAVRLVVDRERSIRDFVSTEHYRIFAEFATNDGSTWRARWDHLPLLALLNQTSIPASPENADGEPCEGEQEQDESTLWTNHGFAQQFASALQQSPDFSISNVETRRSHRKPPAPFTTSTLQQAASVALKLSPDETMKAAQTLFENGLITYMRTDSPSLSVEGEQMIRDWLQTQEEQRGASLLPDQPHRWPAKGNAQEAHEAIRPTQVGITTPDEGSETEKSLYRLIWLRSVASQMKSAEFDVTRVELISDVAIKGTPQIFIARGRVMLEAGWMSLTKGDFTQDQEGGDQQATTEQVLPNLAQGQRLTASDFDLNTSTTKPPPRYTEATLVRALESEGIGRPSTYASILTNIRNRAYIEIKSRKVYAAALGEVVVDALTPHFGFMDYQFTRTMEAGLDQIAAGTAGFKSVVAYQFNELESSMGRAKAAPPLTTTLPPSLAADAYPCPICTKGHLRRRKGKIGHFWSCSNYPDCTASGQDVKKKRGADPEPDMDTVRVKEAKASSELSDVDCPKCGKHKLVKRCGTRGDFWACSGYPKCKQTVQDDAGKPAI